MSGSDRDSRPKRPPVEAAADDPWAKWRQPETPAVPPEKGAKAIPQGDFLRGAVSPKKNRFLTPETLPGLFVFPADMSRVPAEVNQLNNQILVRYFEIEWRKVIR